MKVFSKLVSDHTEPAPGMINLFHLLNVSGFTSNGQVFKFNFTKPSEIFIWLWNQQISGLSTPEQIIHTVGVCTCGRYIRFITICASSFYLYSFTHIMHWLGSFRFNLFLPNEKSNCQLTLACKPTGQITLANLITDTNKELLELVVIQSE